MRRRPGSRRATACGSTRRSIRTWRRPKSSAACSARAGRPCYFANVDGCRFPMVEQPLRHDGAGAVPLPRLAGPAAAAGRLAGRSGRPAAAAAAVLEGAVVGPADPAAKGPLGAGAGLRNHDRPAAAIEVLARRRRGLHHLAASLHRRPRRRRAWPGATWACTACSFPAGSTSRTARSGCTTRSTAASPPTTPPPSAAASRCG